MNAPASAPPVKVAQMTPATMTEGVRVNVDVLHLDDLPGAMEKMGWGVSAQMMRHWFSIKPAWSMPESWRGGKYPNPPPLGMSIDYTKLPASQVNDSIIKMDWAMRYQQVREAMAYLKKHWNSPDGVDELRTKLFRHGWERGQSFALGSKRMSAYQLDYICQMNMWPFGSIWDTLDDFYGAIFRATLKVAVVGNAYRKLHGADQGKDFFKIDALGFYIRDTYDFNANWFEDGFMGLGVWSKERCLSKAEMAEFKVHSASGPASLIKRHLRFPHFVQVQNRDFRRWQLAHNAGGDFFVFSDVVWEPYYGPDIEIPLV
ncbi:hypothetical protein FHW67_000719 [Herbaspirillum sp. Sphag1AN]|uniref:DUF6402 family protein n=1 Tax=unclassified Herbaspirillum TaxID=2624150 RepID=UPI00161ECACD|nr:MULTISPECIES: DUF6402 family protein [unclassified Herbaspirillum]MBB3211471.1 hypothetical protein [Herbaspirillum sp. Sphag1AN]MBB3245263.1 hypothetical protein [Herbaspirillum sp. Sphag64]